jgi:hypothetical protein
MIDAQRLALYPKSGTFRPGGPILVTAALEFLSSRVVPIVSGGVRNGASAGAFEPGAPQVLFDIGDSYGFGNGFSWPYQPGADGQRFLIGLPPSGEKPPPITMVLNWHAGLKK